MTDAGVVLRKLATMREHVRRARRRRPSSVELLAQDADLQDALSMSVLVAVQEAIDIAFHLVTGMGLGVPASNAEVFELLAKSEVIDSELAQQLTRATALRNRIAHGYASLDVERLWRELPDGLAAFDRFAAAVAQRVPRLETR